MKYQGCSRDKPGDGSLRGNHSGPGGPGGGIRAQLKCRASATQQQPPINKRDYRCTTSRISVQEDCSVTSQPVRRWWLREPPPQNSLLSLVHFSFSLSPPPPVPFCPFSFCSRVSPVPSLSLSLPYSFSVSRVYTHIYTNTYTCTQAQARARAQWTDILPSASGAHNKKVETLSPCGHVPHPPSVSPANPLCFPPGHPRRGKST